ncbi:MAG: hypothetical protein KIT36_03295 [Alphaproteobacteria bacterium]|nr:hypothetical protein [Alphaproteobacteria bacterium]
MFFNMTSDVGDRISGYYVPDSFSGPSVVRIVHGRGAPILFEANEVVPSLVAVGRHATGKCAYTIDESVVPGLPGIKDLEIHEPETGLRLYRRRAPDTVVQAKILRLETHLVPLRQLDEALEPSFQYFYRAMEDLGYETTAQILQLENAASIFASGRLLYKTYEFFIEARHFQPVCLLRNPYDELAERLLVLWQAGRGDTSLLDTRDTTIYEAGIEFASTLDLADERQLRRAFRGMSRADAATFSDPLVRSLTTRSPDDMGGDDNVATALHILSGFALVGVRERGDLFLESLAALANVDPATLPAVSEPEAVVELGSMLREIGAVRRLIERDLEVYNEIEAAHQRTL